MGVTMSFTRVSAADLERLTAETEWPDDFLADLETPDSEPSGYLDKAWAGLKFLLEQAETGVDLFFTGRPLGSENHFAWSPDDVSHTAGILRDTPFDKLAAHYDPARMDEADVYPRIWVRDGEDGCNYLGYHYAGLVRVFQYAAQRRSGFVQYFG
ncbi:YfbM family protein [Nocardia sp. NPDC057663]|uniref:YfbM family protein n=1 Tax=Nocardia sp. NPDC057663 TaxID=3346201 RepID=UPI003670CB51